jgi:hypothetical protein
VKPSEFRQSDPPLNSQGGRYKIACPDLLDQNVIHRTSEIDIYSGANTIDDQLQRHIPWMAFKIKVSMPRAGYPSDKNGFQIMITMQDFEGYPYEIPECRIEGDAPHDADVAHKNPIVADADYTTTKFQ